MATVSINRTRQIIDFLENNGSASSKEIFLGIASAISFATLKRTLAELITQNYIQSIGQGRATKYAVSPIYRLVQSIDMEQYYTQEIDQRQIHQCFNFEILTTILPHHKVFTEDELDKLLKLQDTYTKKIGELSSFQYKQELERLAIDLSWKSSQIEGNTYSLLETERLLKEKETAYGKTKEEAIMLLNHKEALDFIISHPDYLESINVAKIETIHSLLIKELGVEKNLRKTRVGISGTNYRPLDNEFQILEALKKSCNLINDKNNAFEKALLTLLLISYIQPFVDGNKRTARILSNAILINHNICPLSFRTVDAMDYKKAMLLFYEQNNVSNFKTMFINQFEFAVETYF